MGLEGVEIFLNPSGSHHQLRKLDQRIRLLCEATSKNGGVYLYSNHRGCDGNRLYFDGASMIVSNGEILKVGSQFSLKDVEVVSCVVDLNEITSKRIAFKSRAIQATLSKTLPRISLQLTIARVPNLKSSSLPSPLPLSSIIYQEEEEIALAPACYLYDFLRRTKASGFFLPLSGGADSAAVAVIVYNMAGLIWSEWKEGNMEVRKALKEMVKDEGFVPKSQKDIVGKILFTCYMGGENSSKETMERARNLSEEIGILLVFLFMVLIDILFFSIFSLVFFILFLYYYFFLNTFLFSYFIQPRPQPLPKPKPNPTQPPIPTPTIILTPTRTHPQPQRLFQLHHCYFLLPFTLENSFLFDLLCLFSFFFFFSRSFPSFLLSPFSILLSFSFLLISFFLTSSYIFPFYMQIFILSFCLRVNFYRD